MNESNVTNSLSDTLKSITKNIASKNANDVDIESRFPTETVSALKDANFLSVGIKQEIGGAGLIISEQAAFCKYLAQFCASSAMILGMHYIKCNSLNEWASGQPFFSDYLSEVHKQQRLIASMTSEEGIGGDLRQSNAAIALSDNEFSITKKSPCLSYVMQADDILLTCRVSEEAAHSDQRLVLLKSNQMNKEITRTWDAMGMRGTCSHACVVSGSGRQEQIVNEPFSTIATQSMIPDAHIIWSNIWLGIAIDAFAKAKKVVRKNALKTEGGVSGSARILNDMHNKILALEGQINTLTLHYQNCKIRNDQKALRKIEFALAVNALKLNASEITKDICIQALEVCGISGYKNDDELSVSKNIRDVLSASVMVSNERLIEVNAARLLV